MWAAVAMAAAQALGSVGQYVSGTLSAKARRAEFDQQIRAVEFKKAQTLSTAQARSAAAGLDMSSLSTTEYLSGLTSEFDAELNYLRRARSLTSEADHYRNLFGLAGGGAQAYGSYSAMTNGGK